MLFKDAQYGLLANFLKQKRESKDLVLLKGRPGIGSSHALYLLSKVTLRLQGLRKRKMEASLPAGRTKSAFALMLAAPYATYIKIIDQMCIPSCCNVQR